MSEWGSGIKINVNKYRTVPLWIFIFLYPLPLLYPSALPPSPTLVYYFVVNKETNSTLMISSFVHSHADSCMHTHTHAYTCTNYTTTQSHTQHTYCPADTAIFSNTTMNIQGSIIIMILFIHSLLITVNTMSGGNILQW